MRAVYSLLNITKGVTSLDVIVCRGITAMSTTRPTFSPPDAVLKLQQLTDEDKLKFRKEVDVPCIVIPANLITRVIGCKSIFEHTLKKVSKRIKPVMDVPSTSNKCVLFDPDTLNEQTRTEILQAVERVTDLSVNFEQRHLSLDYADWSAKQCINAVLPQGLLFSGFSQVGHIVHVNLREELLPYKLSLGRILLEKTNSCRTVVNKLDSIETQYRVFELDLLAGEPEYVTETREGGLRYKLDFKKVFWNSRLSSEHERICRKLDSDSALIDCCAGVGPFVLPAAKKGVPLILANDLNPESIKWLKENITLNRANLKNKQVSVFCMDANKFIRTEVASTIVSESERQSKSNGTNQTDGDNGGGRAKIKEMHLLMNLPASSVTFLPSFRGLLHGKLPKGELGFAVTIHCHLFVKANADEEQSWYAAEAKRLVAERIGCNELQFKDVHYVRKVAGRKEMYCVSFEVPQMVLFEAGQSTDGDTNGVETENHKDNTAEGSTNPEDATLKRVRETDDDTSSMKVPRVENTLEQVRSASSKSESSHFKTLQPNPNPNL